MSSMFTPEVVDEKGYPAWVRALADQDDGIVLYVLNGFGPAEALERLGYPAEDTRTVELSLAEPNDPYSSRVGQALGMTDPEEVAVVSARVGEWTLVYEIGSVQQDLAELSAGGLQAASCSVNIESDTHLVYWVDGEAVFWVTEPLTVYDLAELPDGLREAAGAAGIYDRDKVDNSWDPAENFLTVCSLARLWRLTLDDLCRMPLLGVLLDEPILPSWHRR